MQITSLRELAADFRPLGPALEPKSLLCIPTLSINKAGQQVLERSPMCRELAGDTTNMTDSTRCKAGVDRRRYEQQQRVK
jgi:hypothetical protein